MRLSATVKLVASSVIRSVDLVVATVVVVVISLFVPNRHRRRRRRRFRFIYSTHTQISCYTDEINKKKNFKRDSFIRTVYYP